MMGICLKRLCDGPIKEDPVLALTLGMYPLKAIASAAVPAAISAL